MTIRVSRLCVEDGTEKCRIFKISDDSKEIVINVDGIGDIPTCYN